MSDVCTYVSKNLDIVDKKSLSFPFSDCGFLYGYGLFESIRICNGVPVFLEQHLARLKRGSIILDIPFLYSEEQVISEVTQLIEKNSVSGDAILNFYLTAGDRGQNITDLDSSGPMFLLVIRPCPEYNPDKKLELIF